jgi:uncharacterized OB-fold protein
MPRHGRVCFREESACKSSARLAEYQEVVNAGRGKVRSLTGCGLPVEGFADAFKQAIYLPLDAV